MVKPYDGKNWYDLAIWRKSIRPAQLRAQPWCEWHLARGEVVLATIVDHVEPHRGDWNKFVMGPLQSLCEECANRDKQRLEIGKSVTRYGVDGWPIEELTPTGPVAVDPSQAVPPPPPKKWTPVC
jgi:hypothetical protein